MAASTDEVVRNARQSMVTSANMRYLAERLLQRYDGGNNSGALVTQPEYTPLDLCGDARQLNYARLFQARVSGLFCRLRVHLYSLLTSQSDRSQHCNSLMLNLLRSSLPNGQRH